MHSLPKLSAQARMARLKNVGKGVHECFASYKDSVITKLVPVHTAKTLCEGDLLETSWILKY